MNINLFLLLLPYLICYGNAAAISAKEKILRRQLETSREISIFRTKRSEESINNILGGETEVNPNDPKYQEMAKEVVYQHIRLKKEDTKDITVNKVMTQVSGVKTKNQFQIVLKNGKIIECTSEIQERFEVQAKRVSYMCQEKTKTVTETTTITSPTTEKNTNYVVSDDTTVQEDDTTVQDDYSDPNWASTQMNSESEWEPSQMNGANGGKG